MKKVMFSLKEAEIKMINSVAEKDRRTKSGLVATSVKEYAKTMGYVK